MLSSNAFVRTKYNFLKQSLALFKNMLFSLLTSGEFTRILIDSIVYKLYKYYYFRIRIVYIVNLQSKFRYLKS